MADQVTPTAAPTQADPKTTAGNIVQSIQNKANGKAPVAAQGQATPPAPVDPNAGKEKYVVEGKEVWLTPEQRTVWVQKGMAFEPKMDELARLRQEGQQLVRSLLTDPGLVLKNIAKQSNVPMKDLVQKILKGDASPEVKEVVGNWYYEEAVEPLKLSPEELEARQNKKKLSEYEQRDLSAKEIAIKVENQRRVDTAMGQLKANIAEAMKDSGLADNDTDLGAMMARRVADVMRLGYFQRQVITPKQAIEKVKAELKGLQNSWYSSLDEDSLVKELGPEIAEKFKKYHLKLVKEAEKKPTITETKPYGLKGERKTINLDDFHEQLAVLKKQG